MEQTWGEMVRLFVEADCTQQAIKNSKYGGSWRLRFFSPFENCSRKFLRLVTLWLNGWRTGEEGTPANQDDTYFDTLGDLYNYSILALLFHGEHYPELFTIELERWAPGSESRSHEYTADPKGFRSFMENELQPKLLAVGERLTLQEVIEEKIFPLARSTIEAWLDELGRVGEGKEGNLNGGVHAPANRIANLFKLAHATGLATLLHAQLAPQEWALFLDKWHPTHRDRNKPDHV